MIHAFEQLWIPIETSNMINKYLSRVNKLNLVKASASSLQSTYQQKTRSIESGNHIKRLVKKKKTTALSIPMWSPTIVLTEPLPT